MHKTHVLLASGLLSSALSLSVRAADGPADTVLLNGVVHTIDAQSRVAQGLAIRDGKIVFVGSSDEAKALAGPATKTIDLAGRTVMPGLVDAHMHPLEGGLVLLKCNLNYERLTIPKFQQRIQACLDQSSAKEPDQWLEVVTWFREAMIPNDAPTTRETLDALKTKRPIVVLSSFGHSALVNSRGLALAKIDPHSADPQGGKIAHDAQGFPSGILEDAAQTAVTDLLPKPTPEDNVKAADAALKAMRQQGITSFLDAAANPVTIAAFAGAERAGKLTARGHFAVLIDPPEADDPVKAVAKAKALATQYDQGEPKAAPGLTVRNIKLFMDGVITAPAQTGSMLTPYFANAGTGEQPRWQPGSNPGPDPYFGTRLAPLVLEAARAGLEPHMHADGDRAVRAALDAVEALRKQFPESAIRAAIAHDEIVDPADFPRYKKLGAIPVVSFQWGKPAPDTIDGGKDYLGPQRFKYSEPAGYLAAAGARVAYGSDWPVDALNEWFALKVGITRENAPDAGSKYHGRLGSDAGLKVDEALRGITANSAYALHAEQSVGSLEVGKFADLIILDRDVFKVPPRQIAGTQVLLTMVGGKAVYESTAFKPQ